MNIQKKEQKTILRFLLIGLIAFMFIPLSLNFFRPDPFLNVLRFIFFIFFISLYLFNKTTQRTEMTIHILLVGLYSILAIGFYVQKNTDVASIWLLAIPLFAFILLKPKVALFYSALAFFTIFLLFQLHPESASFMEKFRVIAFGFFLIGTLYILSKSRKNAWNETEEHLNNLEYKVEEALAEKLEQEKLLIHTSKLATLGELLSSIAHQWKQPIASIAAINMNLRIQEELSKNTNDNRIKLIDQLEEQTDFMSKTMDDFRSFFKANDKETAFTINKASIELTKLFDKSFQAQGININQCVSDNIEVFGYSNMYKQALLNIITNAKDAIHENKTDNTDIDITYDKDDTFGIVTVQDHAGGITEDILSKIFEKNFTTKGENGSGIGLAMTKEIIEDFCHGKLRVENTVDGAKFSIYIPLHQS